MPLPSEAHEWGAVCCKCHPLPFPKYSPITEFCDQLAWEVFQMLKSYLKGKKLNATSLILIQSLVVCAGW